MRVLYPCAAGVNDVTAFAVTSSFFNYDTYACATLINCTRLRTLNNCRKRRR
jgi:hypothetical protein